VSRWRWRRIVGVELGGGRASKCFVLSPDEGRGYNADHTRLQVSDPKVVMSSNHVFEKE
jgi:hypothetical protein